MSGLCERCGGQYDARAEGQDPKYCEICVPIIEEILEAVNVAYVRNQISFTQAAEIRDAYVLTWLFEAQQQRSRPPAPQLWPPDLSEEERSIRLNQERGVRRAFLADYQAAVEEEQRRRAPREPEYGEPGYVPGPPVPADPTLEQWEQIQEQRRRASAPEHQPGSRAAVIEAIERTAS